MNKQPNIEELKNAWSKVDCGNCGVISDQLIESESETAGVTSHLKIDLVQEGLRIQIHR